MFETASVPELRQKASIHHPLVVVVVVEIRSSDVIEAHSIVLGIDTSQARSRLVVATPVLLRRHCNR